MFFNVYTNDIPTEVVIYADDTQLTSAQGRTFAPCSTTLGSVLNCNHTAEIASLKLKMNTSKTQGMLCGTRQALARVTTIPELDVDGEKLVLDTV